MEIRDGSNYQDVSSIPWLFSVIAKMKLKECAESDIDTRPNSNFSESELWSLTPREKLGKDNRKYLLV